MRWKVKSQVAEISSFYGMISHDRAVPEGEEKDGSGDGGEYLFHGTVHCWKLNAESSKGQKLPVIG